MVHISIGPDGDVHCPDLPSSVERVKNWSASRDPTRRWDDFGDSVKGRQLEFGSTYESATIDAARKQPEQLFKANGKARDVEFSISCDKNGLYQLTEDLFGGERSSGSEDNQPGSARSSRVKLGTPIPPKFLHEAIRLEADCFH